MSAQLENKVGFRDQVAVITGAGEGIGYEIARQLVHKGASVILNVNTRVALPWSFVYPVTAPALTCFSKIMVTNFAEVLKANPFWVALHIVNDVCDFGHARMIPLLILPCKR